MRCKYRVDHRLLFVNAAIVLLILGLGQAYSYQTVSMTPFLPVDGGKDLTTADTIYYDLLPERFDFQQKCIHHDNFYREVTRAEKWKIGENYYTKYPYYSPRKDYMLVDDGFRIKSIVEETGDKKYPHKVICGYLTNDQTAKVAKSFRLIRSYIYLKKNFYIETSIPAAGKYSEVVFNYQNEENYDSFELVGERTNKNGISLKRFKEGKVSVITTFSTPRTSKSIKIAYLNNQVRIYIDLKDITDELPNEARQALNSIVMSNEKSVGMAISNRHSYEYRVFDVFTFDPLQHVKVDDAYSNGIPDGMVSALAEDYSYQYLSTLKVCGVGKQLPKKLLGYTKGGIYVNTSDGIIYRISGSRWIKTEENIYDYGMYYDTLANRLYTFDTTGLILQSEGEQIAYPKHIQRFEIRASDAKDTRTAHCELADRNDFTINNLNLRKRKISFYTLHPVSYLEDDHEIGGEAFLQFQISTDGGKTRIPLFTIASGVHQDGKGRYHLNRRYIKTRPVPKDAKWKEEILGDFDYDLGEIEYGKWQHWEVYVKEGYMEEHNPLLVVKRNGEEVYRSEMPNTYNIQSDAYFRYGVYKSIYKYSDDPKRKRIIYIAGFECIK